MSVSLPIVRVINQIGMRILLSTKVRQTVVELYNSIEEDLDQR
jgi:hypothetical protein